MIKVKIYGDGSIGNHLAYACRSKGWDVKESPISLEKGLDALICDKDPEVLKRGKV